jgi:multidrug transporter EmrE-like cation transporter
MKWTVPFIFLMTFEIIGNFFTGLFGSFQNFLLFPLVLVMYGIANYFWLQALKKGSGLARGAIYFGVGVIIATVLISFIFYEEAISLIKIIGISTGLISLILLADLKQVKK